MNCRKLKADVKKSSHPRAARAAHNGVAGSVPFAELEAVALGLMAEGEYEAALPYLEQALALNPTSAPTHCHLGQVYYARMMWREAEEQFRKALALDFNLLEAHFNLAVLCQRQRRFPEALAFFKQVVMAEPSDWECFLRMGQCTAEMGNLRDAEAFYAEALRLKPDSLEAVGGLAKVFLATEQLDKAVNTLELGLRYHPECTELRAALAHVYEQDGEYEKALAQFYRLLKDNPEDAELHYHLGMCCVKLGLLREAEPLLAKASQLDPELLEAMEALAHLYLSTGREEEAIRTFEHRLQVEAGMMGSGVGIPRGGRVRILQELAECYVRRSDYVRARRLLEECLALAPGQPEAQLLLARLDEGAKACEPG
ncbi:MAG: tetratricopeptide repeat protein [candidate division KSB1 bacterium]|nr:tetratricopeptide repeat protein [candidate division KSB1 bacterium]